MEIKILIPRYNDEEVFKAICEPSLIRNNILKILQIMDKPGMHENIFKKYMAGIQALIQTGLNDDDIIIFMHSDVGIIDPFFRNKIEMVFNEKKDIGLLGVVGTTELLETSGWWANTPDKLRGHCIQGKENSILIGEGFHLVKGAIGYFDDLVAIDGMFMATTGRIIKEGLFFDVATYPEGNDMYDIDLCLTTLSMGYKIAVADILLFHKSRGLGALTESWKKNQTIMVNKWKNKGFKFPIVRNDFKMKEIITNNNIIEIPI